MAKKARKKKDLPAREPAHLWPITMLGLVFLLVEVVFFPGATSSFRLPKEVVAAAGIVGVGAAAFVGRIGRGPVAFPKGPVVVLFMALPAIQLVSMVWAADPGRAAAAAAVSTVWIGAALWLSTMEAAHRDRLTTWASLGAAASGIVLLLQAAGVPLLVVGRSAGSRFRMSGLAGNPADFATAAVLLLPLLLVAAGRDRKGWWRWVVIAILVLATALSQTLTGYIALAAVGLIWLVERRSFKLWAAAAGIGVLVVALALAAGFGDRIQRQLRLIQLGDWYSVTSARGDGWTAAAEMIRQRPLTGVGARHFTHAYYPSRVAWLERRGEVGRRGEAATHFEWAHCDPLQMVAELGFVGGAWMAAFAWLAFRHRPRGDPFVLLAIAAVGPFVLLHYPTHLAVGMVPIVLVLGRWFAEQPKGTLPRFRGTRRVVVSVAAVVVALMMTTWQLRRLAIDVWNAHLTRTVRIAAAQTDPARRSQLAEAVERQILERIQGLPSDAGVLWRIVGKARLARADGAGAEQAFRAAYALWPHEEADLGTGLALVAQNRRSEAMMYLGRVCRTNPALIREIEDPDLRRALEELNRARRRAANQGDHGPRR